MILYHKPSGIFDNSLYIPPDCYTTDNNLRILKASSSIAVVNNVIYNASNN